MNDADELAADGIRVNNLIPGRIDTERVRQLDQATAARQGLSVEEVRARSVAAIPLGRLGTIDEYGAAAAFLLSPAAAYITGATLHRERHHQKGGSPPAIRRGPSRLVLASLTGAYATRPPADAPAGQMLTPMRWMAKLL